MGIRVKGGENGRLAMADEKFDILGESYPLPRIDADSQTKEHILYNATLLFAQKGYAGVSMRDIATVIGIKPASLYNHFASKEILWKEALDHAKGLYLLYFQQLDAALAKAETFADVLEIMFLEPKRMANVFTCYAFSMVEVEQFRDDEAGEIFLHTILAYSIDFIQGWFDTCIAKGMVRPFDTRTVASFFMNSVIIGLNLKVQECLGRELPYETYPMLADLQRFILRTVGIDEEPIK